MKLVKGARNTLAFLSIGAAGTVLVAFAASPGHSAPTPSRAAPNHTSHAERHRAHRHAEGTEGFALVAVSDPGQVTGTLVGPCHSRDSGQLPDPGCTPGSYDPQITAGRICDPGYSTDSYRPPESQTTRFKYTQAEPAYGQHTSGELDHLVPLELGGSNDAANLWVEAGSIPNPKDKVENALHDWVCQSPTTARLHAAQRAIARNWETAEARLGIASAAAGAPVPVPVPIAAGDGHEHHHLFHWHWHLFHHHHHHWW